MDYYLSPIEEQRFDLVIKNSQFITRIKRTRGRQEAKAFIESIRSKYPDANHHCWAFAAGTPNNAHLWDQSDDGEPKGTAGKPMLNVLQHSNFGETTIVVTRYFGGVKLGAGGLVRAYSQAVQEALSQALTEEIYPRNAVSIKVSYSLLGKVEYWLEHSDIEVLKKHFDADIIIELGVIPNSWAEQKTALENMGQGSIIFIEPELDNK
ncbi:YigZ family protein [Marinomonas sp. 2405UD68-3]|uniref:YigZ family protein n=1 Tax=Marinomonas sp. 2405UD68-3 TaxID=3391835 RepID=UPI0039C9F158